jgi:antitoxin HicB
MAKHYTVSDGKLMLILEPAEEGGYNVSSPMDPQLFTQAETLEEAFANAHDAKKALNAARAKLARELNASTEKPIKKSKQPSGKAGHGLKQEHPDNPAKRDRSHRRLLLD